MRLNLLGSKKLWTTWMPHVAIAVFFILCYFGFRKDLSKISFESLPRSYDLYLLVVGLVCISYTVRAMRWRQYLLTLGYELPKLYGVLTYIAGFAYTLAPGKVGELLKATYYRPYKIPMTVVTAAFFVERLSDLAVFVCLALVFLGFVAQGYGILLIMAGLCVPVLVLLTSLFRERHLNLIAQSAWVRVAGLTPMVVKLAEGIEAAKKLLTFEVLVWGLFWGFAGWLCECLSLYILGGVVPHTPLFIGDAIGIYAAAIVVGAVSFFPGGLGTTEAAMVALLVNYGYNVQDAVMLTIVCRLLTLWVAVLLGWVAVGVLKLSRAGGVFMTLQSSTIGIAINVELPMISVVTVVFNGKDFIERTLKNVLAQDYPNIEYIVIDGGSTDGTLGIVSRYQSRLAYFSSELDCGIYDAMNKGIAVANGAWINFMNAGDEFWAVDTVSKSVNQINGVESILFGGVEIHYPGFFRTENAGAPDKLWQGMQFCHQSAFVSLSYHRANPFNKENKIAADLEFFYTAHQKGVMFKKLNQIVSRVITGGVSEKNRVRTLVASCIAICGSRSHPFIRIYYGIRIVDSILRAVTKMILPKKLVKKIILRKLCITRPPKC